MPSIRKRLKKLTSSKKSKSTSDLDNIGEPGSQSVGDDDSRSYISEAASERTDLSLNESTYSYAEEGKKKKKRQLKIGLSKRKKKDQLVKDPSGNVVFRSLSVEHDPRGFQPQNENMSGDESLLKPENVQLSKSVGSNVGRDDSSEADEWRMSGLLETVNRASNTSLNDNLISMFEERRQMRPEKAIAESTPVKGKLNTEATASLTSEGNEADDNSGKTKTHLIPSCVVEVSFSPHGKQRTEADQDVGAIFEQDKHMLPEDKIGYNDDDSLVGFRRDLEPVEEEDFTEMRNVDPECQIDIDGPLEEGDTPETANGLSEESPKEIERETGDRLVTVLDERSVICDTGRGKRVIIRHLEEVASKANLELSETVNMEDWLVLNIEKDDWVVVGYTKVGGEIKNLFQQSVDTI